VTGHDIKVEYRVFTDTLTSGSWRPGGPFVGYNSCLSITVLPAFLGRLLGVAPVDVYRVCFQLLFATAPVGAYLVARRLLPGPYAVLAAGLFVAFPAFANDMPMLNRQEIALLFFTVAVLALLDGAGAGRQRRPLLVVLAAGLTVSHYTSSYVAAGTVLLAWVLLRLRRLPPPARRGAGLGPTAATLVGLSVAWAGLTGNAATLGGQLRDAGVAVLSRARVASGATGYSFLGSHARPSDAEALAQYVTDLRGLDPGRSPPAPLPRCRALLVPADTLPVTAAGAALARAGLDPAVVNPALRSAAVALFEGGAIVGTGLLWWQTRRRGVAGCRPRAAPERPGPAAELLAVLGAGALVLLAGTVLAPQLADSYGLLRLYQQALAVLAALVVLAVAAPLGRLAGWRRGRAERQGRAGRRVAVAGLGTGAAVVGCLLTTSGLVPQLTGGYPPQLSLNNAGPYFRAYYAGPGDVAAAAWIGRHLSPRSPVVADSRDTANLRSMTALLPREGLAPGAVPAAAFVELSTVDGHSAVAAASVGDRVLRYSFPLSCVTAGRPLVYAAGPHRLYGPAVAP